MNPCDSSSPEQSTQNGLKARILSVGKELAFGLGGLLDAIPHGTHGPAALARTIGVDKLLAGRVLRATRNTDPRAVLYTSPGPDPLRRLVRAARKRGVARELLAAAEQAVERFETLIRQDAGDRSALDAMLIAWLPEARAEFELRRKQTVYRNLSQLLGVATDRHVTTIMFTPSEDGEHLDVVCLFALLGLQRLRSGSTVKFSTRRLPNDDTARHPCTLDGVPVEGMEGLRLDAFCSQPPAEVSVVRAGEVMHYTLGHDDYGPNSATDLVFAEVNRAEMLHQLPDVMRMRHASADVTNPAKVLVFDVVLHEDVFPGAYPELHIYNTAFDGAADINDAARDMDRLPLSESIEHLGTGIDRFGAEEMPRYTELLRHICEKLKWDGGSYRAYRCRVDFPLFGTQVTMGFRPRGAGRDR